MPYAITLIPGDGIGPEVAEAVVAILAATKVQITWEHADAGLAAIQKYGSALPAETLASIRKNKVALKGPTTTPVGKGHGSANVAIRRDLALFASVRPVKSIVGIPGRYTDVDLIIFRENTEGLYAGLENEITKGVVVSLKVVTEQATRRIAKAAFAHARQFSKKKITVVHKANILKLGDGLFLKVTREVAQDFPDIALEEVIVDAVCMRLVRNPEQFEVLLMENLYGDIISDLCAGLVGGLGVVPGANLGEDVAVFEAVHGAAPDIAGKGLANPAALCKSAVMMLHHLGEDAAALAVEKAVNLALANPQTRTADVGGRASTAQFTRAVMDAL